AVEVTPETIRVLTGGKVVGVVPRKELERAAQAFLSGKGARPGARAEFAPEGALGLYVYRGSASFRRVEIQPLAGPLQFFSEVRDGETKEKESAQEGHLSGHFIDQDSENKRGNLFRRP